MNYQGKKTKFIRNSGEGVIMTESNNVQYADEQEELRNLLQRKIEALKKNRAVMFKNGECIPKYKKIEPKYRELEAEVKDLINRYAFKFVTMRLLICQNNPHTKDLMNTYINSVRNHSLPFYKAVSDLSVDEIEKSLIPVQNEFFDAYVEYAKTIQKDMRAVA